jgi:hypothetical protein
MTDRSAIDILRDPPKLNTTPASDEYTRGQEDMRAKVIAFLLDLEQRATENAKSNRFIRREACALWEASELIRRGKEIEGGFDQ